MKSKSTIIVGAAALLVAALVSGCSSTPRYHQAAVRNEIQPVWVVGSGNTAVIPTGLQSAQPTMAAPVPAPAMTVAPAPPPQPPVMQPKPVQASVQATIVGQPAITAAPTGTRNIILASLPGALPLGNDLTPMVVPIKWNDGREETLVMPKYAVQALANGWVLVGGQ